VKICLPKSKWYPKKHGKSYGYPSKENDPASTALQIKSVTIWLLLRSSDIYIHTTVTSVYCSPLQVVGKAMNVHTYCTYSTDKFEHCVSWKHIPADTKALLQTLIVGEQISNYQLL
jgi:hypothetical protein